MDQKKLRNSIRKKIVDWRELESVLHGEKSQILCSPD